MKSTLILAIVLATFGGCAALNGLKGNGSGGVTIPDASDPEFAAKIKAINELLGEGAQATPWGQLGAAAVGVGALIFQSLRKRNTDKKLSKAEAVLGAVIRGADHIRKTNPDIKAKHSEFMEEALTAIERVTPYTRDELAEAIRSKKTK